MPIHKIVHKTLYHFKEMLAREGGGVITSKAVDKARQRLQECATAGSFWSEYTLEMWQDALTQIGFTNPKIQFSGFWSQGDGASFTSGMDVKELLTFITTSIVPSEVVDVMPGSDPVTKDFRPWLMHALVAGNHSTAATTYASTSDLVRLRHLLAIADDYLEGTVSRRSADYRHEHTCRVSLDFWDGGDHYPHERIEKGVNELEAVLEGLRLALSRAIYKSLEEEYYYRSADEQLIEDAEANGYTFDRLGNRE